MKHVPSVKIFFFAVKILMYLSAGFERSEFDLPVISSPIRLHRGTGDEILLNLHNETRASISFVRQVNEFCYSYRMYHDSCTRIFGHVCDDIQSIFHGNFYDIVHTSFRLEARFLLVP